ncbi:hypothetical protein K438DRAFT_1751403 [Mycena galopus ATCC 62051]|nr:hypothetical protein K438DRAFT_1751403 [Mycena galopus ATCC 62051]
MFRGNSRPKLYGDKKEGDQEGHRERAEEDRLRRKGDTAALTREGNSTTGTNELTVTIEHYHTLDSVGPSREGSHHGSIIIASVAILFGTQLGIFLYKYAPLQLNYWRKARVEDAFPQAMSTSLKLAHHNTCLQFSKFTARTAGRPFIGNL